MEYVYANQNCLNLDIAYRNMQNNRNNMDEI